MNKRGGEIKWFSKLESVLAVGSCAALNLIEEEEKKKKENLNVQGCWQQLKLVVLVCKKINTSLGSLIDSKPFFQTLVTRESQAFRTDYLTVKYYGVPENSSCAVHFPSLSVPFLLFLDWFGISCIWLVGFVRFPCAYQSWGSSCVQNRMSNARLWADNILRCSAAVRSFSTL